ncbi:MAG: IS1634 family transposase [Crocosphaera sp.]|nr:IS1634 family transposase [Crocosphaera sp.]
MFSSPEISIQTINHLGLVAGIIDDIGIEEMINEMVGSDSRELVTSGQVVKGIILNGLGFTSQPLYLFPKFFEDKATEYLLGDGIKAEYLNDDKIGRVMDKLYEKGLSSVFLMIALSVVQNYQLLTNFSHLDSSSFSVQGKYLINNLISSKQEEEKSEEPAPITITKGYSRDHRPDLKQFIVDLIVSGDGGIPLFLRVADGNEQDKVVFGEIAVEYKSMIDFETMIVADSALYTAKNLQLMSSIKWLSRVPLSLGKAKELVNNVLEKELTQSSIKGYSWKEELITYADIKPRWLLVESQKRKESDLKKLSERIEKEKEKADKEIKSLMKDKFNSMSAAMEVANRFSKSLKYHQLTNIQVQKIEVKNKKKQIEIKYKLTTSLEINQDKVDEKKRRAGRFILATNELKESALSSDDILIKYKEQQSAERGFGFLKDPLFFADSVFLKSPKRVETMAMLMGLCLLVYSLGQRELRRRLKEAKTGLKNQLGKLTEKPTLRWMFQCFQGIHLLVQSGKKQVVNLTEERQNILSFFPLSVQNYYILSG